MQILQWLFKASQDHERSALTNRSRSGRRLRDSAEEVKPGELVLYNHGGSNAVLREDFGCDEVDVETKESFQVLVKREDIRTCFYSTLNLQQLRSLYKSQDLWHPGISEVGMGHKVDTSNVGCKVLPISDVASIASNGADSTDNVEKYARKGERRRAVSRMKELLRWAAAARSNKGGSKAWKVLNFRHRATLKAPNDDSSSNSSKISFRWDVGSCSTSCSSVYSPLSLASASKHNQIWVKNPSNPAVDLQSLQGDNNMSRSLKTGEPIKMGQWITTDSDFVVLEL